MKTKEAVLDIEIYPNYFLCAVLVLSTGRVEYVEAFEGLKELHIPTLRGYTKRFTMITFNGNNFDLPIISRALEKNGEIALLKELADKIIKTNKPSWAVLRDENIIVPKTWDTIDLIDVAPGKASLKIYGGRLHARRMQDLPYHPDKLLTREESIAVRKYCINDLETTALLYDTLRPQIELRKEMGKMYDMDLRSKADAQIAEAVLKSEMRNVTKDYIKTPKLENSYTCRYKDPKIITFESKELRLVFERILSWDFNLTASGSVELPGWLKTMKIAIGDANYQMGIGGLHSTEEAQYVSVSDGEFLADFDVTSYYPSIILQQKLYPDQMGDKFLDVYRSIVDRRVAAKKNKDDTTSNTLKIVLNSSFGKFGSKYSSLYSPDFLLQTTITGQLSLLMLIERLTNNGYKVVSANTDGIVVKGLIKDEDDLEGIMFDWEMDTSFLLERTDYKILASRDVNNYVAVKHDGKVKRKGCFAEPGLQKNPDRVIMYEAVAKFIAKGVPIEQTVMACRDIGKFVTVRRVDGGGKWMDQYLGKAVRFYKSAEVSNEIAILYDKNSNRVPNSNGCRPLMDLPETFPEDIDYEYYINEAYGILRGVGYVRENN